MRMNEPIDTIAVLTVVEVDGRKLLKGKLRLDTKAGTMLQLRKLDDGRYVLVDYLGKNRKIDHDAETLPLFEPAAPWEVIVTEKAL